MTIDTFICDAFEQWLEGEFNPERVRAIERGASVAQAWEDVSATGFADVLVAEAHGGAGAQLETAAQMFSQCGAHAMPLPLAPSIWVRAVLAEQGHALPAGAITLACGQRCGAGIHCTQAAFAATADWVLVVADEVWLLPMDAAKQEAPGVYGSLCAELRWPALPTSAIKLTDGHDWQAIGAVLFAALMAGAARSVLRLALQHAGERRQFGKPLAAFQALQQQLAVLAEEVYAVRMAVQLALHGDGLHIDPLLAAAAKARAGQAVAVVTAIGHGVHGAIGITEEYDLQLFTRRLHEWRLQFGSERFWQQRLGEALLASKLSTLDFMRERVDPG